MKHVIETQPDTEALQRRVIEMETKLAASEAKFDVIFHHAPDVILVIDGVSGNILDANRTVERLLGYRVKELVGQHFTMILPPIAADLGPDEWLEQLRIHGVAIEGQMFQKADGGMCPMDLTIGVVPWNDGTAILTTLRDVTDRTQAEAAQQKLIRELDAFAHTVAHDLKAPLGVIVGAGEVLNNFTTLDEIEAHQLTDLIMRNGSKMSNIIEELLLLAQMREQDVEVNPLDMGAIVAESQQRLSYMIHERKAEIITPSEWPEAVGYAPWVEEVWVNYVSNALKYGGNPPHIELGADEEPSDMVRFWIQDNGPGLTPEEQQKLFTQFTRLAEVRAEGYGLGLSIVRRIVDKLGGRVGVENGVEGGSIFSFTLPKST